MFGDLIGGENRRIENEMKIINGTNFTHDRYYSSSMSRDNKMIVTMDNFLFF